MANIIEVVGKQHIAGTSQKTGKVYDFTDVHYLGRRKNVEGLAAVKKTVGADIISADEIVVGGHYAVEIDDEGNIIEMKKADRSAATPVTGQAGKN